MALGSSVLALSPSLYIHVTNMLQGRQGFGQNFFEIGWSGDGERTWEAIASFTNPQNQILGLYKRSP
ncbi:MAG TPA: hypothetical protein DCL61_18765, partial [Cyanobacteria bacterium UBA12227]|nr:hypothetical protein [Cyanobacteria bacterium UBA12227]